MLDALRQLSDAAYEDLEAGILWLASTLTPDLCGAQGYDEILIFTESLEEVLELCRGLELVSAPALEVLESCGAIGVDYPEVGLPQIRFYADAQEARAFAEEMFAEQGRLRVA